MQKCKNTDKPELLAFLKQRPSEKCFFLGDVENFDIEEEFIDVWVIRSGTTITSVLLRYYRFYLISTADHGDMEKICRKISEDDQCESVSGILETIDLASRLINMKKLKRLYLAELTRKSLKEFEPDHNPLKAEKENINELFEYQKTIEEFSTTEENRESFGQEIITGTGRMYYIKQQNKIVSAATLTAENSLNGTIIGVSTDKEFRNRGYARACVGKLCREVTEENKSVILFYDNPDAGKLYKSLGFRDINRWGIGIVR